MGGFLPIVQRAARGVVEFLQELARIGAPGPNVPTLSERLLRVRAKVGYLQKDAKNSGFGGGYKYVSHDAVVDAVGDALDEFGIVFGASITDKDFVATGSHDKNQNPVYRTFVFTKYSFSVPETGETREYTWMGDAMDSLDKGLYKAITQSKKTFLLNFFLIATGDAKADADQVDPDFKGRGGKSSTRSNQPNARPQSGGAGSQRKPVGERIDALIMVGGKRDWDRVTRGVNGMTGAGPYDQDSPSLRGWSGPQLEELAGVLNEYFGTDGEPVGGRDQWRS